MCIRALLALAVASLLSSCTSFWPMARELPAEHREYSKPKSSGSKEKIPLDPYQDGDLADYERNSKYFLPPARSIRQARDRLYRYRDAYLDISNAIKSKDLAVADTVAVSIFGAAVSLLTKSDHGLNFFGLLGGGATTVNTRYRLEEQARAYAHASTAMDCMGREVVQIDEPSLEKIGLRGEFAMDKSEVIRLINEQINDVNQKLLAALNSLRPVAPDKQGLIDSIRQLAARSDPARRSAPDSVEGNSVGGRSADAVRSALRASGLGARAAQDLAEVVDRLTPALRKCVSENL